MRNSIQLIRRSANLATVSSRSAFNSRSFGLAIASNQAFQRTSHSSVNTCSSPISIKYSSFSTTTKLLQAIVQENDQALSEPKGEASDSFSSLKSRIRKDTLEALTRGPFHFEKMSEVQQRVLPLLPELADPFNQTQMPDGQGGRDLLVKAKTGTGKTIAFLTPALERRLKAIQEIENGKLTQPFREMLQKQKPDMDIDEEIRDLDQQGLQRMRRQFCYNTVGVLVLSPTRELATQIYNEAKKLCSHHKQFGVQLLVGGASRREQLRNWSKSRPDIVVATPGRLLDMLREEEMVSSSLSAVQTLIYDEADTLLDMGFRDDMEQIVRFLPSAKARNTMLFSATVSKDIRQIARQTLNRDHRFIDCVPEGEENTHEHIPQFASIVRDGKEQLAQVTRLIALDQIQNAGKSKVIVFAPTTKLVQFYSEQFHHGDSMLSVLPAGRNTTIYELHSRKDSDQRFKMSARFRGDKSGASILFTSDVSARGVDYPGTTRVINVGIAKDTDQYIHRIGRTGRAGAQGRANIVLQEFEAGFLRQSLGHLSVQEETVEETKSQLQEICKKFDENPEEAVGKEVYEELMAQQRSNKKKPKRRRDWTEDEKDKKAAFITPLSEHVSDEAIMGKVEERRLENDVETVEEVFLSLVGFYAGSTREIGTKIESVVDGLKQWAVSSGDLPREPYISPSMLQKMGIKTSSGRPQRTSRFGSPSNRERFSSGGRDRFGGEGRRSFDRNDFSRGRRSDDSFERGSFSRKRNQDQFF